MNKHFVIAIGVAAFLALSSGGRAAEKVDDNKAILGTWRGGWPDDKIERFELVITAEKISGTDLADKRTMGAGTFTLNTEKKTIDAKGIEGPSNRRTFLGIYTLEGDTLKWASNNGNGNRPGQMVHKPGSSFLMVLKRQK